MKNKHVAKTVKRVIAIVMAVGMMVSGAAAVLADNYDIETGSVSVALDEDGKQRITQEHNEDAQNKEDNDIVIFGGTDTNTITVDAGATVTLDAVGIFLTDPEEAPLTVTDNNNTGEAATVIMTNESYIALDWGDGNTNEVPTVLVEEGANLDLQVDDYSSIEGYKCYGNDGEINTPAIQLEDGATLNISDHGDGGELDVSGAIGTAVGSDANVTININENKNLEIYIETFDEADGSSSSAIGTGINSTGDATININGGFLGIYLETRDEDAEAIGKGSGATGNTTVNYDGDPSVFATNIDSLKMFTVEDENGTRIYAVIDPSVFTYEAYEAAHYSVASMMENAPEGSYELVYPMPAQPEEPAEEPAQPEEPAEEPAEAAAPAPAAAQGYMNFMNFVTFFVANVGEYNADIKALEGDTRQETFDNFKAYVEKNNLFDTAGLAPDSAITAGQIALVMCKAANVSASGEEDALAKLQEKGILKNRKADSAVPVDVAEKAVKQFVREFLAGK